MVRFDQWIASEHADELIAQLKERKALLQQSLENPELSEAQLLATVHTIQGVALTTNYVSAIVTEARQKEKNRG